MAALVRPLCLALAIPLAACQSLPLAETLRDKKPSTVARIAEHAEPGSNWLTRRLRVGTTSTLVVRPSAAVVTELRTAITHYDALLALEPDLDDDGRLRADALRRSADLRLTLADAGEADAAQLLQRAIAAYRQLLREWPQYALTDRVLYQLARAQELAGDDTQSVATLQRLGAQHPDSPRALDGTFRAGERLFALRRFDEAEAAYRRVVTAGADSPLFNPAQYKLAWSLFRQERHEQALPVLLAILERQLPSGVQDEPAAALAAVSPQHLETTTEVLRLTSLSFAALGGGAAIGRHLDTAGATPRYGTLLYAALAETLLQQRRYSDAAQTWSGFVQRNPAHARAPEFQARAIAAWRDGGFAEPARLAVADYVERYAPDAVYWTQAQRSPPEAVTSEVRRGLDELAQYHHAQAQQLRGTDTAAAQREYLAAAARYQRRLMLFPQDASAGETGLLLADALLDGGNTAGAAAQYLRSAYDDPTWVRAPEAAQAAVQAHIAMLETVPVAQRLAALRQSRDVALKLATQFPNHTQRPAALVHAASAAFDLGEREAAIADAQQAIAALPATTTATALPLRRQALSVIAAAQGGLQRHAEAERAWTELLALLPPDDAQRKETVEYLAVAIYRQAELMRDSGDTRTAADLFLRVGRVTPTASIRGTADYDAAAALIAVAAWKPAAQVLEGLRMREPQHRLGAEIDQKLSAIYERDQRPLDAAQVYARIAQRQSETDDARRSSAWRAAELYDQAGAVALARGAWEHYLGTYPQPLDQSQNARRRLSEIASTVDRDIPRRLYWLEQIVAVDTAAGRASTVASRALAAQASLDLGRAAAERARAMTLALPVERNLPRRTAAVREAVAGLDRAAAYGYADVATAATYELARVYHDLGRALLASERPRQLDADALEQYTLLLEEQAWPFEEKAIAAYEVNLARLGQQGIWDDWVRRSAGALTEMVPARYGKRERRESRYDSLD